MKAWILAGPALSRGCCHEVELVLSPAAGQDRYCELYGAFAARSAAKRWPSVTPLRHWRWKTVLRPSCIHGRRSLSLNKRNTGRSLTPRCRMPPPEARRETPSGFTGHLIGSLSLVTSAPI